MGRGCTLSRGCHNEVDKDQSEYKYLVYSKEKQTILYAVACIEMQDSREIGGLSNFGNLGFRIEIAIGK